MPPDKPQTTLLLPINLFNGLVAILLPEIEIKKVYQMAEKMFKANATPILHSSRLIEFEGENLFLAINNTV